MRLDDLQEEPSRVDADVQGVWRQAENQSFLLRNEEEGTPELEPDIETRRLTFERLEYNQ